MVISISIIDKFIGVFYAVCGVRFAGVSAIGEWVIDGGEADSDSGGAFDGGWE